MIAYPAASPVEAPTHQSSRGGASTTPGVFASTKDACAAAGTWGREREGPVAAQAASALTLVYRDNNGRPNVVEDFVEVLRSTGEDGVSRKTPIALRMSR